MFEYKLLYSGKNFNPDESWVYHQGLVTAINEKKVSTAVNFDRYIISVYWFVTTVSEADIDQAWGWAKQKQYGVGVVAMVKMKSM